MSDEVKNKEGEVIESHEFDGIKELNNPPYSSC